VLPRLSTARGIVRPICAGLYADHPGQRARPWGECVHLHLNESLSNSQNRESDRDAFIPRALCRRGESEAQEKEARPQ
jgi:hypothetical protein